MSKTHSGRSPVRGWLEPKKISANFVKPQLTESHKSKPIARVRPVCSINTVPRTNVVTGHQSPHSNPASNFQFLASTSKPTAPPPRIQRTSNDFPKSSQSHKTSNPRAPSKSNSNVVNIINFNVVNVSANSACDNLAKLKLSNESSCKVSCSSKNDVKHNKPKTVRAQPQSSQSLPRNTPKTGNKTINNKKNESSSRRQGVVVTQKQSSVCKIIIK